MKLFCTIFIACFLTSCNSNTPADKNTAITTNGTQASQATIPAAPQQLPPIITMKVQADTTQTYSLFVPSKFKGDTLAIIFFDPGAKGEEPVEKYQALAERHGVILAGSNNSKNGMSGEQSFIIASKLVQDLKVRFGVRHQNIYASGFSGGARVAVLAAIGDELSGVIGCGGGFPGKVDKPYEFHYVGIVGNQDFNFLEMKRLYHELDFVKMDHQLLVYDGKHEWSPAAEMEKAVLLLSSDPAAKAMLAAKIDSAVGVYKQNKNWVRLYDELWMGVSSGADSIHRKAWIAEMQSLRNNTACTDELKKEVDIEAAEAQAQGELTTAFQKLEKEQDPVIKNNNYDFLKNKIKTLSQTSGKHYLQQLSDKRLLQLIGLMGFIYSERMLGKDIHLAQRFLDVYGKADPENPDYHYLLGCYYSWAGNTTVAMASLKKAVELKFDDEEKLLNNKLLEPMKAEPGWQDLVKQAGRN